MQNIITDSITNTIANPANMSILTCQSSCISNAALATFFNTTLNAAAFKDYCPNGLQVEGTPTIRKLATAVSASLSAIQAAAVWGADALLVHHGIVWRGEDGTLTGFRRARVKALLGANINLFAYHLPLDAHPTLGNNAQLGAKLGFVTTGQCGENNIVWLGTPNSATFSAKILCDHISQVLGREALVLGDAVINANRSIKTVAWCTGGAQNYFEDAIAAGADVFITGEVSEQHTHIARETGVAFIAAGHHATERFGVQALGAFAATELGLEWRHFEDENPV